MIQSPKEAVSEFVSTHRNASALFYDLRHRRIFAIIADMVDADQHVDNITLDHAIKSAGADQDCGGLDYVASLPDFAPSSYELSVYGEKLRDLHKRRGMIEAGAKFTAAGYDALDVNEALDDCEQALLSIRADSDVNGDSDIRTLIRGAVDDIEASQANAGRLRGIPTGFPKLDRILRGMKPGQLIVLAARPGEGKTSLAMNVAEHVAVDAKIPVGVFSLEMSRGELAHRLLCSRARVSSAVAEEPMDERDMMRMVTASGAIGKAPLHICDQGGLTIPQLRAKARRMVQRHGVKLFVVDYLGLINAKGKSLYERVSEVSAGLKQLAKELGAPFVVPAQMNREHDKDNKRKPRLSDLRDSGSVEQDADVVAFIHHTDQGTTLNIEKHRNGPVGIVPLSFNRSITRFESIA
jgi:replicative DNA helicase